MTRADAPWDIAYYRTAEDEVPTLDFLSRCPPGVRAHLVQVLHAVAEAPPPRYSGGGKWEAMHGAMKGFYEVRATGPGREQFRLFCLLDNADDAELRRRGLDGPAIVVLTGMRKPWRSTFSEGDYAGVSRLAEEHRGNYPRRIAE